MLHNRALLALHTARALLALHIARALLALHIAIVMVAIQQPLGAGWIVPLAFITHLTHFYLLLLCITQSTHHCTAITHLTQHHICTAIIHLTQHTFVPLSYILHSTHLYR